MKTLLDLKRMIEPPTQWNGCKEYARIFGLISNREAVSIPSPTISVRKLLDSSKSYEKVFHAPLTMFVQNTALLPPLTFEYKGIDRDKVINSIINNLKIYQPDIVGLTEVFVNSEKEKFRKDLFAIYPYGKEGPNETDIVEQDGGLLLFSRHPITDTHSTIFRQSDGWDETSNKGVLHAHIKVQGHPTEYDVFLAHTQDPDTSNGKETLKKQLIHLNSFIQACRSPYCPALLMGDLNVDAFVPDLYNEMVNRFEHPVDVWSAAGTSGKGITWDQGADGFNYKAGHPPVTDDSKRHQIGKRLDYFICWLEGCLWEPYWKDAEVVVWTSEPGREISDHYGLRIQQEYLLKRAFDLLPFGINKVDAAFRQFHCLTETEGSVPVVSDWTDSDDMEFELSCLTTNGVPRKISINQENSSYPSVNSGEVIYIEAALALEINGDPGDYVDIEVVGYEVDDLGKVSLGPTRKRISREAYPLFRDFGKKVVLLITGDVTGEYAITVEISIH